jgi:hypothetical protein
MPDLIPHAARVAAAGNKPKLIDEYIGRANSGTAALSVAHMRSPAGWIEPGQTPGFDEYTVVLKGLLRVEYRSPEGEILSMDVVAGQGMVARQGEWVRYSTPAGEGAEYIAVCSPAFTLDSAHRDAF